MSLKQFFLKQKEYALAPASRIRVGVYGTFILCLALAAGHMQFNHMIEINERLVYQLNVTNLTAVDALSLARANSLALQYKYMSTRTREMELAKKKMDGKKNAPK